MSKAKRKGERIEILWRILVGVVTLIVLELWTYLIIVLAIVHAISVLFTGIRTKDLADFCEYWSSETYRYARYMTFSTNERPFPFNPLKKMGKFER